jgi:hypothetical protein
VEGRVEAGYCGHIWQGGGYRLECREGLRLVQRGQVDELSQGALNIGVDDDGLMETLAAMNDAVPYRIGFVQAFRSQRRAEPARIHLATRRA